MLPSVLPACKEEISEEERQYLMTFLRGLAMQQQALESQRAAICQQAAAIRKRLGLKERE